MNEPTTTLVGNLVADPELRYTPNGAAVCNFKVAQTPRTFDRQSNEWKDGEAIFMPCSIWREAAENVRESFKRGDRVIVTGRLKSRSYETKEGDKRTIIELDAEEVGASVKYATATIKRAEKSSGYTGHQRDDGSWTPNRESAFNSATGRGGFGQQQGGDPWATRGGTAGAPF
ncbi:single-stranded DNA-binding protein [Dermacoccus sp. UBA1591]|uniref:single-stranded DNA-binding protein n=1 Tax=Dermacoccus sp. UBA1591 TaxID=1946405 RepID=UPI00257B45CB|nr:single-stranded DNA-binding protein [Dermacoccus sp. UBA1591]